MPEADITTLEQLQAKLAQVQSQRRRARKALTDAEWEERRLLDEMHQWVARQYGLVLGDHLLVTPAFLAIIDERHSKDANQYVPRRWRNASYGRLSGASRGISETDCGFVHVEDTGEGIGMIPMMVIVEMRAAWLSQNGGAS